MDSILPRASQPPALEPAPTYPTLVKPLSSNGTDAALDALLDKVAQSPSLLAVFDQPVVPAQFSTQPKPSSPPQPLANRRGTIWAEEVACRYQSPRQLHGPMQQQPAQGQAAGQESAFRGMVPPPPPARAAGAPEATPGTGSPFG
jgi:hypothetical protein